MSEVRDAAAALTSLQKVSPQAIIAGGFLRDIVYCKPAKDIDFFVPYGIDLEALKKQFPLARKEGYSKWLAYSSMEVHAVYDLGCVGGLPAQLIELSDTIDPLKRAETHDFGFCQIAAKNFVDDPITTQAFEDDLANNTVTLVHCENAKQFERSMRRWDRLSAKYLTKKLVIPKEFQQWIHPLSEHWTSPSLSSSEATN